MKKILIILATFVIIIGIIFFGLKNEEQKSNISQTGKPIVKIGMTLALTGDMADTGQDYKKAMDLRLSQIPEDSKYEYKIFYEDDQFQKKQEVLNAQKLININKVDIISSLFSGGGYTIADMAINNQIIQFDNIWDDKIVKKSKYSFMHATQPNDMAKKWLDEAYKRGVKKISIIAISLPGCVYTIDHMKKLLPNYPGMEIIDLQYVNFSMMNYEMVVKKMAEKNPDIYMGLLVAPSVDIWGKELKLQNNTIPVSTIGTLMYSTDLRMFENAWMIDFAKGSEYYFDTFKEKYNSKPYNTLSVFGYDIIDIIYKIYEKYDTKPTGEQVANDLLSLNTFDSTVGKVSIDKDGMFHSEPSVKIVKNGKLELLEE